MHNENLCITGQMQYLMTLIYQNQNLDGLGDEHILHLKRVLQKNTER